MMEQYSLSLALHVCKKTREAKTEKSKSIILGNLILKIDLNILSAQNLAQKSFGDLLLIYIGLKIMWLPYLHWTYFIPKGSHIITKAGDTYGLPKVITSASFFRRVKIRGTVVSQSNIFPREQIEKYAKDILDEVFWNLNRSKEKEFADSVFPPPPILPHLQNQTKKIFGKMRGQRNALLCERVDSIVSFFNVETKKDKISADLQQRLATTEELLASMEKQYAEKEPIKILPARVRYKPDPNKHNVFSCSNPVAMQRAFWYQHRLKIYTRKDFGELTTEGFFLLLHSWPSDLVEKVKSHKFTAINYQREILADHYLRMLFQNIKDEHLTSCTSKIYFLRDTGNTQL